MKRLLMLGTAVICVLSLNSCAVARNLLGAGGRTLQSAMRTVTG